MDTPLISVNVLPRIEVSRVRALRGPNLWSRHTAIEAIVTCYGGLNNAGDFLARLRQRFPDIGVQSSVRGAESLSLPQALELATLGMQAQAGCPVTFSRSVQTIEANVYQVIVEYTEEAVGRLALDFAQALCRAALDDRPFDLMQALAALRELDEDVRLGPSTGAIVHAAVSRGIPYRRLTEGSLVQLGWGKKQRRIQAAETDRTSAIAEAIAQDKELTKTLLHAAGVPVPAGRPVNHFDDACAAAREFGWPVVLKPQDGNQGKGVTVNITDETHLRLAFDAASSISSSILLERYLPGHDYRLLVVGDRLIAAARRDPPYVMGDGVRSIRQLVDQVNSDPRRGEGHATSLTKIRFDDIALARLAEQGFDADSIAPTGTRITLRNNANLSTGGTATDVTDDVHPDLAMRAVAAAQMVGLDICGIDVICDNVLQPLETQGGGIVEVNAAPGLRMHLQPSYGKGRAVGDAIVSQMFAPGENGRIPVIAVAGTNGKTTTVRLIAHLLSASGKCVGMTGTEGVFVGGECIDTGDCSGPRSARNVLMHPDVDAAVFETARGGVLREGLGFDRCDVAVVTNIGSGDHLGLSYISTVEDLAVVKRVIVQNAAQDGVAVLNAADPMVAAMADFCPGSVTFFAADRHHPIISTRRAQGQRVVFVDVDHIVATRGKFEQRLPLSHIPLTHNGTIRFQVENVMAAIAATWALGLAWKTIVNGLASFVGDANTVPGRFNVFNYRGATLIADYGHNPDAIQALTQAVSGMPANRRSVVISGAGDRRDEDIRRQTQILGDAFDQVILYQDQCQRGRADGEVLGLLREGLVNARRAQDIQEIRGEFVAIDTALADISPGDLCLILVDQVEAALAHIAQRVGQG